MEKIKNKNSSLELLRIISMLLIIACHYVFHGKMIKDLTFENINNQKIYLQCLMMFGRAACSIFVLITGYFLVFENSIKKLVKKIVNLIIEMIFYSALIYLIYIIVFKGEFSYLDLLKCFVPIPFGSWFGSTYVLLLMFVPFINKTIKALNRNEYKKLLIIFFVVYILLYTLTKENYFGEIGFFVIMYFFGGYISIYKENFVEHNNRYLIYGVLSAILMIMSVVVFDYLGIIFESNFFINHAMHFREYNSILSFTFATSFFIYFSNKQLYSSFINKISSCTFGIYLIHDNYYSRIIIWNSIYPNIEYVNNPLIHSIVKIIVVFIVCAIIEKIRQLIFSKINIDVICDKIAGLINIE